MENNIIPQHEEVLGSLRYNEGTSLTDSQKEVVQAVFNSLKGLSVESAKEVLFLTHTLIERNSLI